MVWLRYKFKYLGFVGWCYHQLVFSQAVRRILDPLQLDVYSIWTTNFRTLAKSFLISFGRPGWPSLPCQMSSATSSQETLSVGDLFWVAIDVSLTPIPAPILLHDVLESLRFIIFGNLCCTVHWLYPYDAGILFVSTAFGNNLNMPLPR